VALFLDPLPRCKAIIPLVRFVGQPTGAAEASHHDRNHSAAADARLLSRRGNSLFHSNYLNTCGAPCAALQIIFRFSYYAGKKLFIRFLENGKTYKSDEIIFILPQFFFQLIFNLNNV
jgi:hypothetical protein